MIAPGVTSSPYQCDRKPHRPGSRGRCFGGNTVQQEVDRVKALNTTPTTIPNEWLAGGVHARYSPRVLRGGWGARGQGSRGAREQGSTGDGEQGRAGRGGARGAVQRAPCATRLASQHLGTSAQVAGQAWTYMMAPRGFGKRRSVGAEDQSAAAFDQRFCWSRWLWVERGEPRIFALRGLLGRW